MLYAGANQIPFEGGHGGNLVGAPYRVVLHTVEGMTFNPSTKLYYGHRNPPHFTLDYLEAGGTAQMWQHYPTTVAARALENRPGGVQTNRQNAIQIEIVWTAATINDLPGVMWDALAGWLKWCRDVHGVAMYCPEFGGEEQYGLGNVYEFSFDEWAQFDGVCGHQHVPENAHWDPGAISLDNLARLGLACLPKWAMGA